MTFLQTPDARDFSLDPTFVEFSKDDNVDVAVVGNGGSITGLSETDINTINNCRLFRCNWAFKDPSKIKKQYTLYFSQAYGAATHGISSESHLAEQVDSCINDGTMTVYRYWIDILYNENPLCTFVSPNGVPVWPTTGIQMLMFAAFQVNAPAVHIAGIDLYSHARPAHQMSKQETMEYLKKHGKPFSDSRDGSCGITLQRVNLTYTTPSDWLSRLKQSHMTYHFLHVDIMLMMICFYRLHTTKTRTYIYESKVVEKIQQIAMDNIDMLHDYVTSSSSLDLDINKKNCYRMWRLVNQTANDMYNV